MLEMHLFLFIYGHIVRDYRSQERLPNIKLRWYEADPISLAILHPSTKLQNISVFINKYVNIKSIITVRYSKHNG